MENTFMKKPTLTSACILSFALSLSLGALGQNSGSAGNQAGSQQPGQPGTPPSSKSTDSPSGKSADKMGSRNRLGEASGSMVGAVDQKFMMDAAKGGMMEVQLGQTAQQKASSDGVKDFGKKMEQDHGQANKELAELAKAKNVSLPADPGEEKKTIDKLSGLSGEAFDKAYIKTMVRDHKKDVKEFERESTNGMDSDVKAWAAKTLPTLREHLRMAEDLEKTVSGKGKGSSTSSSSPSGKTDSSTTPKEGTTPPKQ
jgi:putative membrane protein